MSTSTSAYQPSIYGSYSTYPARTSSCEHLLPAKKTNLRYSGPKTTIGGQQGRHGKRIASNGILVANEQKKSYGIGGAGNIRRPSEVIYPPRTNADGTRRRPSVWSTITTATPSSSQDGKRVTLLSLFSRKGGASGTEDGSVVVERFKDVDSRKE